MNPAVTITFFIRKEIGLAVVIAYLSVQGRVKLLATRVAHFIFEDSILQMSSKMRAGSTQGLSEGVVTFGLFMTIFGAMRWRSDFVPYSISLYITAAY